MPKSKENPTPSDSSEEQPTPAAENQDNAASQKAKGKFATVGIGASAGGLEALEQFFTHLPPDSGMAFVIIVHLSPDHKSMISTILQKYTDMPVLEIADGMKLEPNTVYVIVPDANVGVLNGTLQLLEPTMPRGRRAPVDYFFRSLADDQAERTIAVVLSGTGSNGSMGLKAIKGAGGMAMVQQPETAKYDGMPRNAIATDLADYILPPVQMPDYLIDYVTDFEVKLTAAPLTRAPQNQAALQRAFILLRDRTGHDFSSYKRSTIERRLSRRMAVHQFDVLQGYVNLLAREPAEVDALFKELLIGVTNFFRDPEAFEVLKEKVLPHLFDHKPADEPLRVWVAGCSTGEEAYSLAIVIKEFLSARQMSAKVQIFASDIDADAIDFARAGLYPDGIRIDVSPERLSRFFTPEDGNYQINSDIREMVVFAQQSVIRDAPFSRLDLISCRNVLIYLQAEIQQKVLNLFHYSLRKDGILFLGTSETRVEAKDRQFVAFDIDWKFFKRVGESLPGPDIPDFTIEDMTLVTPPTFRDHSAVRRHPTNSSSSARSLAETVLLDHYAPAAAVVDPHGEIIYIHGQTDLYLYPPTGEPPFNLLNMARESLNFQLRSGIHKAYRQKETIVYDHLRIKSGEESRYLNLTIRPISENKDESERLLVIFEAAPPPPQAVETAPTDRPPASEENRRMEELEQELTTTKAYLQTTVEELEASNEDVRAANEELQATNEELQSLNEELQTSQEELRSSNEELMTMNTDFQNQINDLRDGRDDIQSLLASSQLAVLVLDMELRIKHFTAPTTDIIRLIPSDMGRPLDDLTIKLDYDNLAEDAKQVLKTLHSKEVEVQSDDGVWYHMQLAPYRTMNNVIAGVVITFMNITVFKESEAQQVGLDFINSILNTLREPFLILTAKLRVVAANRAFYQTFQVEPEATQDRLIYELGDHQWDIPELRQLLEQIIPRDNRIEDFEVQHEFPTIGRRLMRLNGRRLLQKEGEPDLILLAIEDVTEKEPNGAT